MKSGSKPSLLIISNLYPLPWEPNRATFNHQQFDLLRENFAVHILVPVAFVDWIRHRRQIIQSDELRYAPYFYTPKFGRRFYSYLLFASLLLHSGLWIKRLRAAVAFASWAYPDAVAAGWIARLLGIPFFFKVHGTDINIYGKSAARARQILATARRAAGIVSVSKALADELMQMGVAENKINVIYNGVDFAKFGRSRPSPHKRDYILYAGNLKHDKGVMELLDGFALVSARFPDVDLVFAGEGAMRAALERRINDREMSDRVRFLGVVDYESMPAWMSNSLFVALPSYHEGVPNVLLEAMACGKPVLATKVGGIPEVVDSDEYGRLISPRDAEEVGRAISVMLKKTWDAAAIRSHSRSFSWADNRRRLSKLLMKEGQGDSLTANSATRPR